jgi:hypothetical protein
MNISYYVTLVSVYLNVFSVFGLLLFLPISLLILAIAPDTKFWFHSSYVLKKFSMMSIYATIAIYTTTLLLWIISLFVDTLPSLEIFLTFIKMMIFGFLIWSCSLFLYTILLIVLSIFGVALMSLSQLKNELKNY